MRQTIGFIVILSTFYINSIAQDCNLSLGIYVIDTHDNTVLEKAEIRILNTSKYGITNNEGYLKFDNLCIGEYEVEISHVNCETLRKKINLKSSSNLNFYMEHHLETLNEILLKGELYDSTEKTTVVSRLSEREIDNYSSQTLGDALNTLSGVSTFSLGRAIVKPVIHGLHSSRILTMNNGVRQEDQQWGVEHAPNIDINNVSSIKVVKGSSALQYGGDAVGGVIITQAKKAPLIDTLMGKAQLSGISNGRGGSVSTALIKSFKNGLNFRGQGSLKIIGDSEAPDYVLSNTGVREENFALGVGLNKINHGFDVSYSRFYTEIGILRASHNGNAEQFQNAIESDEPRIIEPFTYNINAPRQEVTHQLFKAVGFRKFNNFGKVTIQYDYQNNRRFEYDIRRGDDRDAPSMDLELQTHSLLIDAVNDAYDNTELKFGVAGRFQNNFPNPETGIRRFIPDYDKFDFGAYFSLSTILNERFDLDAGLRYDFVRLDAQKFYRTSRWEERGYDVDFAGIVVEDLGTQLLTNPVYNFHNFSGALGIAYKFNSKNKLFLNYSLATRPPNPAELFSDGLHHSLARIELGDLRFDQEISNKVLLSYQHNSSKFNAVADVYYNNINGFMFIAPFGTQQTNRGFFPVWEYRQTDAVLYGFDTTVDYVFNSNFRINNRSSLTIGENVIEDTWIIDIPPFNTSTTFTYKNKKWYDFTANLSSEIVLEQTRFPNYNIEIPVSENESLVLDTSTPPSGYSLWHLSLQNTFKINKNTLSTSIYLDNILNTSYRNYLNQLRFFADDLGRNIRLQLQFNF
jgi:iron complex outermembrane receptor protein